MDEQHLDDEALALLADEEPTLAQRMHLGHCVPCAERLRAFRELTQALGELDDRPAPPGVWTAVEAALRPGSAPVTRPWSRWRVGTPTVALPRLAAAALLLAAGAAGAAGGAMLGRGPSAGDGRSGADAGPAFTSAGANPTTRLAALDAMLLTTRAALRDAPADPVLRRYHAQMERERTALLRDIPVVERPVTWF
ncbi:MAG: hypothetical protein WKG32_16750 [Gemmatimonadaceae bacterium]